MICNGQKACFLTVLYAPGIAMSTVFWGRQAIVGRPLLKQPGPLFICGRNLVFPGLQVQVLSFSPGVISDAFSARIITLLWARPEERFPQSTWQRFFFLYRHRAQILLALQSAKEHGLTIPIVYNSSGYESTETLRLLEGYVDIYLPDFKYMDPALSLKYSHAQDYFTKAKESLAEMVRQAGSPVFDPATGLMKRGVIVRHLLLPGQTKDSKKILRYLHTTYENQIFISIMNQYTPLPQVKELPELNRRVSPAEYERVLDFALRIGIENGFFQEGETASDSFIPEFDERGL